MTLAATLPMTLPVTLPVTPRDHVVLCCVVLCCIVLCCVVLCCIVFCCVTQRWCYVAKLGDKSELSSWAYNEHGEACIRRLPIDLQDNANNFFFLSQIIIWAQFRGMRPPAPDDGSPPDDWNYGNYGELWGIMRNYGELWGIMGNDGELWWNYGELWWNYGELWGIMGNYGELWGIMGNLGGIMGNYGEHCCEDESLTCLWKQGAIRRQKTTISNTTNDIP